MKIFYETEETFSITTGGFFAVVEKMNKDYLSDLVVFSVCISISDSFIGSLV